MSRNLNCNCLCHGSDGNHIGDSYFACKNCYAANHMGNLPRQPHEQPGKPKAGGKKGARKPKTDKPELTVKVEPIVKPSGREGVKLTIG